MDENELKKLSGSEFLTLYLDKLWQEAKEPWYLRGQDTPYIIARPRELSQEDFDALARLIGGGREYSALVAAYVARCGGSEKVRALLHGISHAPLRESGGAFLGAGRSKLITLAFALGGGRKRADDLLRLAGFDRLYARDARDAGLIFALNNGMSLEQWQEKIAPISARYDPVVDGGKLVYVNELRSYVSGRQQMQSGQSMTLDLTGQAGQTLDALRGGGEVFESYLRNSRDIVASRDRARFYLCRALLGAIDSQIDLFEQQRKKMNEAHQPYDRTAAAQLLPKLVFGSAAQGGESLRFSTQTKAKFDALDRESFGCFKINYAWLCRELSYFYGGDYAWLDEEVNQPGYSMRGMTSESLQNLFSGMTVPGRGTIMRLLLFLDSISGCRMSFARLDGMLTACGFAGPDMRNVDDRFLLQLMLWPAKDQRAAFVTDFLMELEDEGLSYPSFRLLENVGRSYPELFESRKK